MTSETSVANGMTRRTFAIGAAATMVTAAALPAVALKRGALQGTVAADAAAARAIGLQSAERPFMVSGVFASDPRAGLPGYLVLPG